MTDKFIRKVVNISLAFIFILFSVLSAYNLISIHKDSQSLDSFNDLLSEEEVKEMEDTENTEDDLNVPIKDTDNASSKSNNNNLGVKYEDKNIVSYKLEILNLESLSSTIPTNGDELYEIYYSTLNQVSNLMTSDTYAYIDSSTVSYKDSTLKFSLFNYANDKKISDISVKILKTDKNLNTNTTKSFKIENISLLEKYAHGDKEFFVYVYSVVEKAVIKLNPNSSGCLIKEETISETNNTLSFSVVDSTDTTKVIKVTLDL